ncbi:hypothetical protein CRYUN_Cryun24cG0129700 [Craigia yunnanensis]
MRSKNFQPVQPKSKPSGRANALQGNLGDKTEGEESSPAYMHRIELLIIMDSLEAAPRLERKGETCKRKFKQQSWELMREPMLHLASRNLGSRRIEERTVRVDTEKLEQHQYVRMEMLNKYATDLTKMAQEDKLDPFVGRLKELERVTQILCKRRKNNPCLIGDPGVGKTVIVEGIFAIDMGLLIAGTSNRGEFEERLTKIIDEVKQSKGAIILFIDEVTHLFELVLECIGATTLEEYRKYIEKDAALKRRFQPVEVPEPSVDEAVHILKGLSKNMKLTTIEGFLPDTAIDLIDEAGARVQLYQAHTSPYFQVLTEDNIQQTVALCTGIPIEKVSFEETVKLLNMEKTLQKRIIGKRKAVEAISRAIRRARIGVRDPSRPIASFLFTVPTGVGKTEMAKALAVEYYGSREALIRVDMSEYMEKHTVSKFCGSPPGYIGYDEGGQLTEAVRRRPHTVVLFDEIEKAHRSIFDIMLQILEDGRLTDNKGKPIDFKNTIIIMTANLEQVKQKVAEELNNILRPEFLNRIDEVIVFHNLTNQQMKEIADLMLKEVSDRVMKLKDIKIQVTESFKEKLVEEGYNPSYGARPLRRAIVRVLEDALAEGMLNGHIKEGGSVKVDIDSKGSVTMYQNQDELCHTGTNSLEVK